MKKSCFATILLITAVMLLAGCGNKEYGNTAGPETASKPDSGNKMPGFILTSKSFADGAEMPRAQACAAQGGANQSPPLAWSNPPAGTAVYVLIMDDENPPCGRGDGACRHWSVYNIPAAVTGLGGGQDLSQISGAAEGRNYTGKNGYAGPCPPARHTYKLTLYALREGMPQVPAGTALTRSQFEARFGRFILGEATLTGSFAP